MPAEPELMAPTVEGTRYSWRFGNVSFEVDAAAGARITGFSVGSENILTSPEVNPLNYGSTFWSSPQSDWGWPPETEIDSEPYEPSGAGVAVSFASRPGKKLGIAVSKHFEVDKATETVTVGYTMENRSDAARTVAPWEISRVATGGLTFFPAGPEGTLPPSNLGVREANGILWFDYDPRPITDHQKLFADGAEGWIAHVDIARRLLLVKTFADVPRDKQAPGEAEIEVYADPQHTYVEVEEQGPLAALAPGERTTWVVKWRLRRLPAGIIAAVGSPQLAALVRAVAREG